ncbi:hypothetical protein BCY84_05456 [Trypanosoma cruzi cruzi]|nr:hypothetical protein BCY84_05456 [Trypanosoma cruzi cruzi]
MTTALCASPAARMRRAATCGRATRACGAEHTFLSLLFCFLAARAGRHPRRHTHTHAPTPCRSSKEFFVLCVFISRAGISFGAGLVSISFPRCFVFFCCAHSPDGGTRVPSCFFLLLSPPHTRRVTVRCGPPSRADERAEGSSNAQMTP